MDNAKETMIDLICGSFFTRVLYQRIKLLFNSYTWFNKTIFIGVQVGCFARFHLRVCAFAMGLCKNWFYAPFGTYSEDVRSVGELLRFGYREMHFDGELWCRSPLKHFFWSLKLSNQLSCHFRLSVVTTSSIHFFTLKWEIICIPDATERTDWVNWNILSVM